MFKKILLSAAALTAMAFGASQAQAGYGYGYSHGYSHNYGYSHSYSYQPQYSYSHYQPSCYTQSRPVTIRVWDDYSCEYIYKTIYRDYRVCY